MRWARIVLDFDGVVIDSAECKQRAFYAIFSRYAPLSAFDAYLREAKGIPRRTKFTHLVRDILGRDDPALIDALCDEFAAMVRQDVAESPMLPGAIELLRDFAGRVPMEVLSATPEQELCESLDARGLRGYFARVTGGAATKAAVLTAIVRDSGADPTRILFVGDTASDQAAARESGVAFARIGSAGPAGDAGDTPAFRDLHELRAWIAQPTIDAGPRGAPA